jgi:hypothetical protein
MKTSTEIAIVPRYTNRYSLRVTLIFLLLAALHCSTIQAETGKLPASTDLETEEDFIGEIDTVLSETRIRQPLTESLFPQLTVSVLTNHALQHNF